MIIIINGSMNSGKTTVANILKSKIPHVAHIEKLRQFIEWMPIEESISYNIQNIISLSKNFLKGGLNVIVSYPMSNENYHLLEKELSGFGSIYSFTLAPNLELVIRNRGTRELADWEVEQIKKSYTEELQKADYGIIIDNSHQTPDETAKVILKTISSSSVRV